MRPADGDDDGGDTRRRPVSDHRDSEAERYSAESDEEDIGEMDEGDLGGDFDTDEQ